MNELIEKVEQWAIDRNLHTASPQAQTLKVVEEFTEMLIAVRDDNVEGIIDGVGDTYVTLIILCKQLDIDFSKFFKMVEGEWGAYNVPEEALNYLVSGLAKKNKDDFTLGMIYILATLIYVEWERQLTPEQCLSVAYNEIKDRKGKMIDGVFVKESDLHDENS